MSAVVAWYGGSDWGGWGQAVLAYMDAGVSRVAMPSREALGR